MATEIGAGCDERVAQGLTVVFVVVAMLGIWPGCGTIWCVLSSPSASGWAQAFGAIAAIAVTAFLASSQERKRARYANQRACQIAKSVRLTLHRFYELEDYRVAIKRLSVDDLAIACRMKASVLDEYLFDARSLPIEALKPECLESMSAVRHFALQVAVQLREAANGLQDERRDSFSNEAIKRGLVESLETSLTQLLHELDLARIPITHA